MRVYLDGIGRILLLGWGKQARCKRRPLFDGSVAWKMPWRLTIMCSSAVSPNSATNDALSDNLTVYQVLAPKLGYEAHVVGRLPRTLPFSLFKRWHEWRAVQKVLSNEIADHGDPVLAASMENCDLFLEYWAGLKADRSHLFSMFDPELFIATARTKLINARLLAGKSEQVAEHLTTADLLRIFSEIPVIWTKARRELAVAVEDVRKSLRPQASIASGRRNGGASREEIPALDWEDLQFGDAGEDLLEGEPVAAFNDIIWSSLRFKKLAPADRARSSADLPRPSVPSKQVIEWYRNHIRDCQRRGKMPSAAEDLQMARAHFSGKGVSRSVIRQVRKDSAPPSWKARGRRKKRRLDP